MKSSSNSLDIAQQLFHSSKYREAENECREILKKEPDNIHALFLLGQILWMLENKEEAAVYFNQCVELNPRAIGAIRYLGLFFSEKKEYRMAKDYFEYILSIKEDATSYHKLSVIYLLSGSTEKAYSYSRKAASLEPENRAISQQQLIISLYC
ncbi:MAG: tetratricopeptide repeat protein, partial [Thermostichus sp. DG02_4_bins_136]